MGNITSYDQIPLQSNAFFKKLYTLNYNELIRLYDTIKIEQKRYSQEGVNNIFTNKELGKEFYRNLVEKQKKITERIEEQHKARANNITQFLLLCKSYFFENPRSSAGNVWRGDKLTTNNVKSNMIESTKMDEARARRMFRLKTNEKLDESYLKKYFKKLAMNTHPDRPGGNKQLFEEITEAYTLLHEKASMQKSDKQFNTLKMESQAFREEFKRKGYQNKKMKKGPKGKFDVNKFNELFQENRVEAVEDEGYGDWMKKNKDNFIDEGEVRRKMASSSGGKGFNDVFASLVPAKKEENAILKYEGPQALYHGGEQAVELGVEKITNFGGGSSQIKYTDLREAHSGERMIDPNDVSLYDHKTVHKLKKERTTIKEYSEDEWSRYQQALLKKEEMQQNRENYIKKQDELTAKRYDSIHSRMLENVWRQ